MTDNIKRRIACKLCIIKNGIVIVGGPNGAKIKNEENLFMTEDDFIKHLESFHHRMVRRDGETNRQARKRFLLENPDACDAKKCDCDGHEARRSGHEH